MVLLIYTYLYTNNPNKSS